MKKLIALLLVFTVIFLPSCNKEQKIALNPQWDYKNVKATGKIKSDSYTFCSIIPELIEYEYKVGKWTFYSPEKIKIAEGIYDVYLETIDDHGGCPYSFYDNTVEASKWTFWDSNGKQIPVNKRDLDFILNYQINN